MNFRLSTWRDVLGLLLAALTGLFIFQMIATGLASLISGKDVGSLLNTLSDTEPLSDKWRRWGLFIAASSSIGAFVVAPLIYIRYLKRPLRWEELPLALPRAKVFLLCLFVTWLFMLANAQVVKWNQGLELPEMLSGLEQWIKEKEVHAQRIIEQFTQMPSVWDFLATLCVVALIPAVGEELLFRGLLQAQLVRSLKNIHIAIWCTALLFSFFHLQFYGFVPRLLLGALFGYMYFLSGSLWVPVFAHFTNNASVVFALYIEQQQSKLVPLETQDLPPTWVSATALILMGVLIYALYLRRKGRPSHSPWIEIYQTTELHRAEMVRDCLERKNLHSVLINKKDSAFTWGSYSLGVTEKEAERAKRIIDEELDFI